MRNRRLFLTPLLLGALLTLATIGGAASAAPGDHGRAPDHASVIAYWTADRIASAQPRDVAPNGNGRPDVAEPQKPGGNGGGGNGGGGGGKPGGGTSTTSSGSSWTGGGAVKERVGKVLFTMAGADYVCSGTVVADTRASESMVLTAGHCVYDEVADAFATNWVFMPDFDEAPSTYTGSFNCGILPYGCWTAEALVTSSGWSNADFNEDYGFAVIGDNGGVLLENLVGAHDIAFSSTRPASVHAFGYPHSSPYNGSDLVYCNGSTVADGWGGSTSAGVKCDMTGGSSGGGWFASFDPATGTGTLVSVNSFKYTAGPYAKYMFGPRFDGDAATTYAAAQAANGNVVQ